MNKTFSWFAFPLNRCASIPSGENESSIRDEVTRTDKFLTKYKRMRVRCTVLREHRNPVTFDFIYIYIWKSRYSFRSVYFRTFLRILKATSWKRKKLRSRRRFVSLVKRHNESYTLHILYREYFLLLYLSISYLEYSISHIRVFYYFAARSERGIHRAYRWSFLIFSWNPRNLPTIETRVSIENDPKDVARVKFPYELPRSVDQIYRRCKLNVGLFHLLTNGAIHR